MSTPARHALAVIALLAVVVVCALLWSRRDEQKAAPSATVLGNNERARDSAPSVSAGVEGPTRPAASLPVASSVNPVLLASNLADAFEDLRRRLGDDDPATRAAWASITEACDSLAAYQSESLSDPLRDWAASELSQRCNGIDFAGLNERYKQAMPGGGALDSVSLGKMVADGKIEDAVTAARENLRRGDLASSSALDSMLFLVESDSPPASVGLHPDNPDGYRALGRAAVALTCERQAACGPDSLTTLSFCVRFGCRSGSTLLQGMQQSLAPRDYENVINTLHWIRSL